MTQAGRVIRAFLAELSFRLPWGHDAITERERIRRTGRSTYHPKWR